jgi:mannan endo-1,4-beta-mannosidase
MFFFFFSFFLCSQIQVNGTDWGTLSSGSLATAKITGAPFDFSASLAL